MSCCINLVVASFVYGYQWHFVSYRSFRLTSFGFGWRYTCARRRVRSLSLQIGSLKSPSCQSRRRLRCRCRLCFEFRLLDGGSCSIFRCRFFRCRLCGTSGMPSRFARSTLLVRFIVMEVYTARTQIVHKKVSFRADLLKRLVVSYNMIVKTQFLNCHSILVFEERVLSTFQT